MAWELLLGHTTTIMSQNNPHPGVLFSLVPTNDRAETILTHPENAHLVSVLDKITPTNARHQPMIDIGPYVGSKSRYTLATIGRCGDICVDGAEISRIQCSFEVDENTHEVLLQDRSSNRSTQLHGDSAKPFEEGRPHRRVVID